MRAPKCFPRLATTMLMVTAVACAPVVRRNTSASGGGGAGGEDPSGGTTAGGGVTESGGTSSGGGVTASGGSGGSGGDDTGGTVVGGTTSSGGATGGDSGAGSGGTAGAGGGGGLGGTTSTVCGLGTSYAWTSTQALMNPVSDGSHSLEGIKAPSLVYYQSRYHVFATVLAKNTATPTLQHIPFADWGNAGSATADFLDNNSGLAGSRSQPQIFYLNAKKTWYLISQAPTPSYSTNADLGLISGWSKPVNFYSSVPSIVSQNAGGGVAWTDFWIICDGGNCHLFFTNPKGYLFRAQTSTGSFPGGFGDPVVVMQSSNIAQGVRVYKVSGGSGGYLMLVEGAGSNGSYVGAWSATALDGKWTALAETEANPFAGAGNVTFTGTKWTRDIGHGELVRSTYDETMTVDNCNMRYLYAGKDPYAAAKAEPYPWKLGLLVRSK